MWGLLLGYASAEHCRKIYKVDILKGITIEDFVFFIEHWGDDNCDLINDYCQGTDLDFSGTVDEADLEILVENWLAGGDD